MKLQITKGSTSQIITVFIQDSSATDGSGLGSLDESSSIVGGYVRPGGLGVALAVDENVTTEGTYEAPSTAAQVRIGTPANMRTGTYELHFHNDLFASGADSVFITLGGATDMADLVIEIQLTGVDLNDAAAGGMSRLDAAISSLFDPTTDTVDGITYERMFKAMMAVLMNEAAPSGSDVAFYDRAGSTIDVTITYGGTNGQRTASVLT